MASASSSAQAAFGLGRRKKNPGLLDQIGKFFGGDKKRKGKGSFRGALSPAPQKASVTSPRKRGGENAVVHFFRTIVSNAHSEQHLSNTHRPHTSEDSKCSGNVSPSRPKSRWRGLANKIGLGHQKSSKKTSAGDGKGTLTRIFKMGSRSASPAKR